MYTAYRASLYNMCSAIDTARTDSSVKTNLQDNRSILCDTYHIVHESNIDDDRQRLRGLYTAIDLLCIQRQEMMYAECV